ncbi:MAG: DUF2092 domain-containing protein [Syntrophobacteraceae bacterium]
MRVARWKLIQCMALMLVTVGLLSGAFAQDQKMAAKKPDAEAVYLLNTMAEYLAAVQQLQVRITSGYDVVQPSGQKVEFREVRQVTLVRPARMRVDVERDDGSKSLVLFDGSTLSAFDPGRKILATASRPGDIDGALKYFVKDLKMRIPLAMMLTSTFPAELQERVKSKEVVQRVTLFDVPCIQIAARGDHVDLQVWIPEEGAPLPRRVLITYKNEMGQPQFWADFSHWSLAPNPPESTFMLTPPEGTERVPFLAEMVKASGAPAKKGGRK